MSDGQSGGWKRIYGGKDFWWKKCALSLECSDGCRVVVMEEKKERGKRIGDLKKQIRLSS